MTSQVTFSFKDSLEKLQKSLEGIAPALEDEVNLAIRGVAEAAYASIVKKAQTGLNDTRQDYLKGLTFEEVGDNSFLISLDGDWPNKLEEGFPSYDLVAKLLKSTKTVEVGSRAGQSWVQQSKPKGKNKETHKYAHVPFHRQPFSKAGGTSNMADAIKSTLGRNSAGDLQRITKIFRGENGEALEGKVAVAHEESIRDPRLSGLVKYQKIHKNAEGKERVQSIYISYRTISETGRPWTHPGWRGLHAFDEAEADIARQVDNIIRTLF